MPEPSTESQAQPVPFDRATLSESERNQLRENAVRAARSAAWMAGRPRSAKPRQIYRRSLRIFGKLERELYGLQSADPSEDLKVLFENMRLVRTGIGDLEEATKFLAKLPQVRTPTEETVPRPVVLARALLDASQGRLNETIFTFFVEAVQEVEPLRLSEISGMLPALKIVLLERLTLAGLQALEAFHAEGLEAPSFNLAPLLSSLRLIGDVDWKEDLERLSFIHRILLLDPGGVYPAMDLQSRQEYRLAIEKIAAHSDVSEIELARRAIKRAESARIRRSAPDALTERLRHVGYYFFDATGSRELLKDIGYRPAFTTSVQALFRRFPDEVYIIGIESVTLITVVAIIMSLVRSNGGLGLLIGVLLLLIPATQAAVELMNYLVTVVLTPRPLPKLDFSEAVDPRCATMVAIPTLLINEKQIRQLADDLEVRYLVNRDPNIFFALLTDLPDTAEPIGDEDLRIDLARQLIEGLNQKYSEEGNGGFYLFHRHRIYNPREGTWMGWERKRGKLLDLNQLLRKTFDPFPIKAGDLTRLPEIRYVLTLDSDTQLPRGSAARLIGCIAHPLNRALVDPELNIVTQGYGILQPRVGISVHSATRSRLAGIYSGQTGFDIYSRAVSDVYQDLYGEGIFTGKGIYEIDALRQVLERRFPRNALLSHDLIEGAYARAGLISDIEVIDDYPSHYSAYNRRRHRWLRGDWQIVRWLLGKVPDESGRLVANPISLVSKWKILDNLRRSLVEPATFLLLVAGWFFLPGTPRFWTLVTLALLFLPIYFRLIFSLFAAAVSNRWAQMREAFLDFLRSHVSIFLNIAFLAHQSLVALDAIIRTVIRSNFTHSRLLEWETATEAELGIRKRTPVDVYLDWIPVLSIALGLCLLRYPEAAPYALPFFLLWGCSKLISIWINRSAHPGDFELGPKDHLFLRDVALRTWRYFAEFSNAGNHWLIPDNVQEQPYRVAERLSPTNLGLLFNARQVAHEFGYLTVSEFVEQTEHTLLSALKLPRHYGHFLNWYDNITMKPLEPQFVSSVDSGNLVASLWSLKQGCLELLRKPVIRESAIEGLADYRRMLGQKTAPLERELATSLPDLLRNRETNDQPMAADESDRAVWARALQARIDALRVEAQTFMPWLLPDYEALEESSLQLGLPKSAPVLSQAEVFYADVDAKLQAARIRSRAELLPLTDRLRSEVSEARAALKALAARLQKLADDIDRLARGMSFKMLVDHRRNLLSIGFDVTKQELNKSCYDLLASESRTATFLAVAKGEAPQEAWFRLGRSHTLCEGQSVLVSWTGTMFEYLMPIIWMKSHPDTLLDRAVRSAVRSQQSYARNRRVPWGISEAAYSKTDAEGNYQYAAFGVPGLALSVAREGTLVISPYSSCLALLVDPVLAVKNLRSLAKKKWLGRYGFYESADYTASRATMLSARKYELVRCWMVHHQGMSLAAICNMLKGGAFQRWFHAEPLVQASELILQERPLRVRPISDGQPRRVLPFKRRTPKSAGAKVKASA